jgi:hypothetical protein
MTHTCELLINIVTINEPKMLTGSGQNGTWSVNPLYDWDYADKTTTGGKAGSNPSLSFKWNRVSPYLCLSRAGEP